MSVENQGVALRVTGAALAYGDTELVRDVNLSAASGELLALLGPSGSGKTSLLRAIAGFLPLTAGEIRFDGVRVNELPVEERQLGMVFQEHRLFPALTVYRNLEVCLTGTVTARVTAAEAAARIAELLPALGDSRRAFRRNSPADSSAAWRWLAPFWCARGSYCSMSLLPALMRRFAGNSRNFSGGNSARAVSRRCL